MEDSVVGKIFSENKKAIIILIVCIVVSIFFMIASNIMNKKEANENDVDEALLIMADLYYDSYYKDLSKYDEEQVKKILSNFEEDGIKVTLANFLGFIPDLNEEIFFNDKKSCDLHFTNVVIYPKSPYGSSDYRVEVNKSCNPYNNSSSKEIEKKPDLSKGTQNDVGGNE